MPDQNGWTRVEEPTGWKPVKDAAPAAPSHGPSPSAFTSLDPNPVNRLGTAVINHVWNNPVSSAAVVGGMIAAPFTGGASLPTAMAAAGLGGAGGAGLAIAGRQLHTGTPEDAKGTLSTMATEGAVNAAATGVLGGIPIAARGALGMARSAPSALVNGAARAFDIGGMVGLPGARTAATGIRLLQKLGMGAAEAAPAAANAGGRLVRGGAAQSAETMMADALAETRVAPTPNAVSLPPEPRLPPGYKPRTTAPAAAAPRPAPTPVKVAGPKPAPAPEAPAAATAPPAAPVADELPASWKALVEQKPPTAAAPTPKAAAAPKAAKPTKIASKGQRATHRQADTEAVAPDEFDDVPFWGVTPYNALAGDARAALAGDARATVGSVEAGRALGMTPAEIRAAAPGPSRIPAKARLAQMDADYLRRINDPRGAVDPKLAVGMGAAAAVPTAEVLRRALMKALSGEHSSPRPK